MSFELNLTGVQEQTNDFSPLKEGNYQLSIEDTEVKTSKNGNQYIEVKFNVLGPVATGRKLFENFMLSSEVGLSRLKTLAVKVGLTADKFNKDMLHGKKFNGYITCKEDEYNGEKKIRNRISSFSVFEAIEAPKTTTKIEVPATDTEKPWA